MKPDWKDAPPWANWLVQDSHGEWNWWENEPFQAARYWWCSDGQTERAYVGDKWKHSKEKRP